MMKNKLFAVLLVATLLSSFVQTSHSYAKDMPPDITNIQTINK